MSGLPPSANPHSRRIAAVLIGLMLVALVALALVAPGKAHAGTRCDSATMTPQRVADAAATALLVASELDKANAPVALVSRVGTDLSKHGLRYSHSGFAVRDHVDGRWTMIHLLNDCSTDGSGLYAQGLVNFFADDLVKQDARITWLEPAMAERLADRLLDLPSNALFTPNYNLIARPGSNKYQNSTSWVLEHVAAAIPERLHVQSRQQAYLLAKANGFQADIIHIPYSKRIAGGLFGQHIAFTDHSVATRLVGDYPVVTVRSILGWLEIAGFTVEECEWRDGHRMEMPGPA